MFADMNQAFFVLFNILNGLGGVQSCPYWQLKYRMVMNTMHIVSQPKHIQLRLVNRGVVTKIPSEPLRLEVPAQFGPSGLVPRFPGLRVKASVRVKASC